MAIKKFRLQYQLEDGTDTIYLESSSDMIIHGDSTVDKKFDEVDTSLKAKADNEDVQSNLDSINRTLEEKATTASLNELEQSLKKSISDTETSLKAADTGLESKITETSDTITKGYQNADKTLQGAIDKLNGLSTVEGSVDQKVQTAREALQSQITENTEKISTLNGADSVPGSVQKQIKDATTPLKESIDILTGGNGASGSIDQKIQNAQDALQRQITDNKTSIDTLNGGSSTSGSVDYKVKQAQDVLQEAINSVNGLVTTLNGSADVTGSVQKQIQDALATIKETINTLNGSETTDGSIKKAVADGIASIVAGAPDNLNDLKEIATWISSHETSAGSMQNQITENKNNIGTLNTQLNTVKGTADAALPKGGGTMTGTLTLNSDPTADKQAATKKYVDDKAGAASNAASTAQTTANNAVPKSGGTMTGLLTLSGAPTDNMHAATKGYVDTAVAGATSAASGAQSTANTAKSTAEAAMPKSGGTFTGLITLSGAPTANLHAATKQYVDTGVTEAKNAASTAQSGVNGLDTRLGTAETKLTNLVTFPASKPSTLTAGTFAIVGDDVYVGNKSNVPICLTTMNSYSLVEV